MHRREFVRYGAFCSILSLSGCADLLPANGRLIVSNSTLSKKTVDVLIESSSGNVVYEEEFEVPASDSVDAGEVVGSGTFTVDVKTKSDEKSITWVSEKGSTTLSIVIRDGGEIGSMLGTS